MSLIHDDALALTLAKRFFPVCREGLTLTTAALGGGQLAEAQADSNLNGLTMATADVFAWWVDPVGDLDNFDLAKDIWAQVLYTAVGGGAADTGVIWKVGLKGIAVDEAIVAGVTAPDGSKTLAAEVLSISGDLHKSLIAPLDMVGALVDDDMAQLYCELDDSGDASADEIVLIGVRLYGTRKLCVPVGGGGPQST